VCFVVTLDSPGGFVCVVAIFCSVYVVAIFDVFAVDAVIALLGVFAVGDVVAGAVFGLCNECRFVSCLGFYVVLEFFDVFCEFFVASEVDGIHEGFVLFFGFLFIANAIFFASEIPAHETVLAISAVE